MGGFVEVTAKTLRNEPAHYSFRAGFNAKGVASQSPGLNAAFCVQLWDKIHLHLYPVRIVSRRNPFRIDSAFAFPPGLAKSTPTLGFATLPRWGRMHRIFSLNCQAMTSVSRVGNSQSKAGGFPMNCHSAWLTDLPIEAFPMVFLGPASGLPLRRRIPALFQTHPVGLATPAHLQAESAGPLGKSVHNCFRVRPVSLTSLRIMGQIPFST